MIIGHIAKAIGKEKYHPYLDKISQICLNMLSEHFEMNEAVWTYFKDIAATIGQEILPLLESLTKLALKSCMSEEGIRRTYKKQEFSLDSDSDKEVEKTDVRTAFIDEKASAL